MPIRWTPEVRAAVGDLAVRFDTEPRSYMCVVCETAGHSDVDATGISAGVGIDGHTVVRLTHHQCRPSMMIDNVESVDELLDGGADADWACVQLGDELLLVVSFKPMELFVMTPHGPLAAGIAAALEDGATLAGTAPGASDTWWVLSAGERDITLTGRQSAHLVASRERNDTGWGRWWEMATAAGSVQVIMAYGLDLGDADVEQQMERLARQAMMVEHRAWIASAL